MGKETPVQEQKQVQSLWDGNRRVQGAGRDNVTRSGRVCEREEPDRGQLRQGLIGIRTLDFRPIFRGRHWRLRSEEAT